MPNPQIHLRREDDGVIEIRLRLTPELIRSMTATDQLNLGSRIHDGALRKLNEPQPEYG